VTSAPATTREETIAAGGDRVHFFVDQYSEDLTGLPVVVFLHGTTMDASAWQPIIAMNNGAYNAVQIDFPGSGGSSLGTEPLTVEQLAHHVSAVVSHLAVPRYHVAGYSLGAVIAAACAAIDAQRVATAALLCGWATSDARQRLTFDLWSRLISTDPTLFMHYALVDGFTAPMLSVIEPMAEAAMAMGAQQIAAGSLAHLDLDKRVDIDPLLDGIRCPALVLGARQDRWVDFSHSEQLAARIASSRLVELPAGHLALQECAGDISALIVEHITEHIS